MKEAYSAKELAEILGKTKQAIWKRAEKEKWSFKEVPNPKGGGIQKLYLFSGLPEDVKRAVVAREAGVPREMVDPETLRAAAERRLSARIEGLREKLERFSAAPERYQKVAEARRVLILALENYARSRGLSLRKAMPRFCEKWNAGKIPRGAAGEGDPTREDLVRAMNLIPHISEASLKRWRKAYQEGGLVGLLPEHQNKGARGIKALSPDQVARIKAWMLENPDLRPVHLWRKLVSEYGEEKAPPYVTVWRAVGRLLEEDPDFRRAYLFVKDPNAFRSRYEPAFGEAAGDVPYAGHTWEVDGTKADVITADGRRCTIVGCIDVYSRRKKFLVCDAESAEATAALLRWCLVHWGVPKRIRFDRGKGFMNERVKAALSALGIEAVFVPPYSPWAKPFIERAFRTMAEGLMEVLPGYVGHNVAQRQAIRERFKWVKRLLNGHEVVRVPELTREELQEVLDKWCEIYERREHRGLGGKTPLQAWEESPERPPVIRDERVLNVLLAEVGRRKVGKKGISFDGGVYTAEELAEHVGKWVVVRRDFERADMIYVFDLEGRFLCRATDPALSGLSPKELSRLRRERKRAIRREIAAWETISKSMDRAYTVEAVIGKAVEEEPRKVVELRPSAEAPGIREAEKAFRKEEAPKGLAQKAGLGEVVEFPGDKDERREEKNGLDIPYEILDNPILVYEYLEKKEREVGLTPEEREHMEWLVKEFPQVRDILELREEVKKAAMEAATG